MVQQHLIATVLAVPAERKHELEQVRVHFRAPTGVAEEKIQCIGTVEPIKPGLSQ
jgi:hypothetical protein